MDRLVTLKDINILATREIVNRNGYALLLIREMRKVLIKDQWDVYMGDSILTVKQTEAYRNYFMYMSNKEFIWALSSIAMFTSDGWKREVALSHVEYCMLDAMIVLAENVTA